MPAPILDLVAAAAHLPPRGALIGLDLGTKTIGVAASDPDRRLATGVTTIARKAFKADAQALLALAAERRTAGFVLGLPININVGMPGPRRPGAVQHPLYLDEVCYDFPDLTIVMRHGGDPWADVCVKLLLKWPNLYYCCTDAWAPKHYRKEILEFANTRGADKIIYGGYFPALSYERIFRELAELLIDSLSSLVTTTDNYSMKIVEMAERVAKADDLAQLSDLTQLLVADTSRMQANSLPDRVNVSAATYEAVKDAFRCEPRSLVEVKGKGLLQMYLVSGPR